MGTMKVTIADQAEAENADAGEVKQPATSFRLEFCCLWELVTGTHPQGLGPWRPATIATAIEREGLSGRDALGREGDFGADSPEAAEAYRSLIWVQDQLVEKGGDFGRIEYLVIDDHPLLRYGWPADDLPDLKVLEVQRRLDRPQAEARISNSNWRLVAALSRMLLGKMNCKPHPEFDSIEKIALHVDVNTAGSEGSLSQSSVLKKIRSALKVRLHRNSSRARVGAHISAHLEQGS